MFRRIAMTTVAILLCGLFASSVMGEPGTPNSNHPNAAEIVKRMKQALEPSVQSVRVITLKVNSAQGSALQWKMALARAQINDSNWILTVMVLASAWGEGIALLDEDKPSSTGAVEYIYLPAVKRVRRFTWLQAWEPFFGSDFSYRDFSFLRLGSSSRTRCPVRLKQRPSPFRLN
jgi:Outer membrane lipoprotein-sorting protein